MSDIAENISKIKKKGIKVIGCFPLYPPLELLHSFGLVPLVLWDMKNQVRAFKESDRHLQGFTCSAARRLAEFLLSEEGALLDGIFMYNACDTLRNMPEIIQRSLGEREKRLPFFRLHVPMVPSEQTDSKGYLADRIHELITAIEKTFATRFSSERFLACVKLYNAIRKLCLEMEALVAEGKMSYALFSRLIRNGYLMAPEDLLSSLKDAISQAEACSSKNSSAGRRIIVSGIFPPPDAVCTIIEEVGMIVTGNDVATQARSYSYIPQEIDDPVNYYADFYQNHHPCTTLLYSSDKRLQMLMELIEKRKARGMIFIGEKFCEYEYLEMPFVEKLLEQKNIATLQLEIAADDEDNVESLRTRVETFSELIR
ncbi:MAG: 2-hydroxyacyl-CoA dehydratase [Syntrophaceae bacterium]|nr:2-hydroxyacyl-CoA dehydratase [Syntrophaceae bacterium]